MMQPLNVAALLKSSPEVLSRNDDIFLVRYRQRAETEAVSVSVSMNLVSLVLRGRKEIHHHSGKIIVPEDSGFFMKQGSYLMTERIAAPGEGYEAITILLSDNWLQQASLSLSELHYTGPGGLPPEGNIALLPEDPLLTLLSTQFRAYFDTGAEQERLESLLPAKMKELFEVLLTGPGRIPFAALLHTAGEAAGPDLKRVMESHFKENLSLDQYAFLAHCSLATFKRKFRQLYNQAPGKWIQQRRLEEAYYLLQQQELSVSEVAYEVGFESPSHFASCFKELYGLSPKQQQLQWLQRAAV